MSLNLNYNTDEQLGPESRLKFLYDFSGNVEIDYKVNPKLYYKSGVNMFKQFNVYYKEGSWENALCIYLKYEKLFFDKIRRHPEYGRIPVNFKSINDTNFRIIKPKAEHAKRELFKRYKRDYEVFLEELKANNFEYFDNDCRSIKMAESDALIATKSKQSEIENSIIRATGDSGIGLIDTLKLEHKLTAATSFETTRKTLEQERLHTEDPKLGAKKRVVRPDSLVTSTNGSHSSTRQKFA